MNRVGLGLAVGAGYVLGRTRKMKLAVAVGSLVAGKRMHLSPKALADLMSQQLQNNPQLKEIGDELREDLRGVGKAASGAMVERQIGALADRLHGRTAEVRDRLAGVVPDTSVGDAEEGEAEDREPADEDQEPEEDEEPGQALKDVAKKAAPKEAAGNAVGKTAGAAAEKAPVGKTAKKAVKKAPAGKGPAKKAQAKKAAAKKSPAGKTAGKKATAAQSAARGARSRLPKGGGER